MASAPIDLNPTAAAKAGRSLSGSFARARRPASPAASSAGSYMPALDGLRALAVLAVIFYHANLPPWLPGGFLGVECFFVISGFLITSLLYAEWERDGRLNFKAFWLRRARRLLPALFLLLLGVLTYSVIFLPGEVAGLRRDAGAAAVYISNWYLIFSHQSYFEAVGRPPLLRHLWSLAVEEQFYLVWPLIFSGLMLLNRRSGAARRRRTALLLIGAGAIASSLLMAALYQPLTDPSRPYYGTDTRAAGLLIGAVLALLWAPVRARLGAKAGTVAPAVLLEPAAGATDPAAGTPPSGPPLDTEAPATPPASKDAELTTPPLVDTPPAVPAAAEPPPAAPFALGSLAPKAPAGAGASPAAFPAIDMPRRPLASLRLSPASLPALDGLAGPSAAAGPSSADTSSAGALDVGPAGAQVLPSTSPLADAAADRIPAAPAGGELPPRTSSDADASAKSMGAARVDAETLPIASSAEDTAAGSATAAPVEAELLPAALLRAAVPSDTFPATPGDEVQPSALPTGSLPATPDGDEVQPSALPTGSSAATPDGDQIQPAALPTGSLPTTPDGVEVQAAAAPDGSLPAVSAGDEPAPALPPGPEAESAPEATPGASPALSPALAAGQGVEPASPAEATDPARISRPRTLVPLLLDVGGLLALAGLFAAFFGLNEFQSFLYLGGFGLVSLATAVVILASVDTRARVLPRLLGWGPLRWLGLRSYGLYLWHWPVFQLTRPQLDLQLDGLPLFGLRMAITLVVVEFSYRLIEMPVRRGILGRAWRSWREASGARRTHLTIQWATAAALLLAFCAVLGNSVVSAQPPPPPDYLLALAAPLPSAPLVGAPAVADPPSSGAQAASAAEPAVALAQGATPEAAAVAAPPVATPAPVTVERPLAGAPHAGWPSGLRPIALELPPSALLAAAASRLPAGSAAITTTAGVTAAVASPLPAGSAAMTTTAVITAAPGSPAAAIPGQPVTLTLASPAPFTSPLPPGAAVQAPLTSTTATLRITAIGDSVMRGAAVQLLAAMPGIEIDADIGRLPWHVAEVLQAHRKAGTLRDVVVIHTGGNGLFTAEMLDQVMAELADRKRVIFLTVKVPREWESYDNQMLETNVKRYPNAMLLDWRSDSLSHPDWFWGDGIHLREDGAKDFARLIADAVFAP